ncbi:hypothetical protein KFL_014030030 [Klebsormidium nitens]|uniref:Uncharacterized protein n=1 Tax=Klebsormidium nitens TaxID=105231 RepID=A0A1Y1IUH6_KLENI|nr:hypothetical protein KFL_014030030 [Klebsormidium nitens]|eukprot:GAQ93269.1 hypothetical protein KFL_014030030 [Klebsormidium nitens]
MPTWLAELVNNHAGHTNGAATIDEEQGGEVLGASIAASIPERVGSPSFEQDCSSPILESPNGKELLLVELSKLLSEKAGDPTSTYAGSIPHGLYGTYYCYRTHGPRRCFFGHMHTGSNNFNLLKRGRIVFYRCHGNECSHKPAKKLGVLNDLKTALQDATTRPVDPHDDMQVVTQYTSGTQEVQELLLKIVVEHAAPEAYANLGSLFAYMYMIEGRIFVTTNEAEKSRDQLFFAWNGSSWIQDNSNLVTSVFTSQMGCLLKWYEKKRERALGSLYSKHPDLQDFVVGGVLKPLNPDELTSKQLRKIKHTMEACVKERNESMPSFGKINVQDITDVRKCLHSVIRKLHSYVPQYKLCLFTNYMPHFPGDDTALLRRMVLISFNYVFKSPDELDKTNKWHKPIDVGLKYYSESDEGAADTLEFCVQGAMMYYARKRLAPTSKVLSPVSEAFSAAAKEYAGENDKLQAFIDDHCVTEGEPDLKVAKADFVEAFKNFLFAGGHDVGLAGDGLTRALRVKGFLQTRPGGGNAPMISTLDKKSQGRGYFGIRLKTEGELNADPGKAKQSADPEKE